jgi:hypothetical protein
MKYKTIKDSVLQLITLKLKVNEIIDNIYHESEDICLKIYSENPISIFVENPRGFELLSTIFKKRIIVSEEQLEGDYPIKKYFIFKDVEFFCLYKTQKQQKKISAVKIERFGKILKILKILGNILSVLKTIGSIIVSVLKFMIK